MNLFIPSVIRIFVPKFAFERMVTIKKVETKKNLWVRFRIFCHGVASEFKKVNWPTRYNMVKYSIATIVFVVFLAVFFYVIDVLFALLLGLV